jgi:hypothetical protein
LYYRQDESTGRERLGQGGKESELRMVRGARTLIVVSALIALTAGSAAAATPQRVYRDLADNGRLDGTYSRAEIELAFGNPSIPAYARPERAPRAPQSLRPPGKSPRASVDAGRTLPFSGLDLALFGAVGAPLLLLGAGMRHFARTHPEQL